MAQGKPRTAYLKPHPQPLNPQPCTGKPFPQPAMNSDRILARRARATAPKAAAIAGILFGVLSTVSMVLLLVSLPASLEGPPAFAEHRQTLTLALNLVPFSGIAFLWFIGVVRDRFGEQEDQFFATVFFGSGLLFLAMMFVSAAVSGSLLLAASETSLAVPDYYDLGRLLARQLLVNYAIRMGGVFMISTCSLFLRTGVLPRWISFWGYGLALVMLFRVGHINRLGWVALFLPLWILLVSLYVLIENYLRQTKADR